MCSGRSKRRASGSPRAYGCGSQLCSSPPGTSSPLHIRCCHTGSSKSVSHSGGFTPQRSAAGPAHTAGCRAGLPSAPPLGSCLPSNHCICFFFSSSSLPFTLSFPFVLVFLLSLKVLWIHVYICYLCNIYSIVYIYMAAPPLGPKGRVRVWPQQQLGLLSHRLQNTRSRPRARCVLTCRGRSRGSPEATVAGTACGAHTRHNKAQAGM